MVKEFITDRLLIKRPTKDEQYDLWNILKDEKVNRIYMITPSRFSTRKEFLESLNNWEKQEKYFYKKIDNCEDDNYKYTWSIFLKDGTVIGQITVQPNSLYPDNPNIRDLGWFIDPNHQGKGYMKETAKIVLDYMFREVGIDRIVTSTANINIPSQSVLKYLRFKKTGETFVYFYEEDGSPIYSDQYILTREMYLENK